MTEYEFLIKEELYNQLINYDFTENILLIGARLYEQPNLEKLIEEQLKPEIKRKTFITSSIVSQRLGKLNKKIVEKPKLNLIDESSGLIKYLISDFKPVEVYVSKDKMHLIIKKNDLNNAYDYFNKKELSLIGLTFYDANSAKKKFNTRNNPLSRIANVANDFLLMDLMNYLKKENKLKFSNFILLYKDNNLLRIKSTRINGGDFIKPLIKYKEKIVESEFDKFFKNDGFNEEEYQAFFN